MAGAEPTPGARAAADRGFARPGFLRRSLWAALAAAVALPGLLGLLLWGRSLRRDQGPAPPPAAALPADPRAAYDGPFQNIHPDVQYVGSDACAGCHVEIAQSFRQHPMGRSLRPVADLAGRQRYDAEVNNPFERLGLRFHVEQRGDRVWQQQSRLAADGQPIYELELEVHYVIGSGRLGYSYVTDRDGYLFQTPISWFTQQQKWDRSPGFEDRHATVRPLDDTCLFCHANRARLRAGTLNHYDEPLFDEYAIGCERCHGPGERHVQSRQRGDVVAAVDTTIVNPRRLEPALREAVCQQCHLEGGERVPHRGRHPEDFRPGLPLDAVWSVFVETDSGSAGQTGFNHVEQMVQSRCFRDSAGPKQLGCTSCHDPHVFVGPERRAAHYRERCLQCHQPQGCTGPPAERAAQADSCIACHMPRSPAAQVAHTATTDHRILRRGRQDGAPAGTRPAVGRRSASPLVPFARDRVDADDRETARDLGIALAVAGMHGQIDMGVYGDRALALLESAVRDDPGDLPAGEAKASALAVQRRPAAALDAFEAVLARDPGREACLAGAAELAQAVGDPERSLTYARRAVQANPWIPEYRATLALLLARRQAWDEVRPECRTWMRLDPESVPARLLWIRCLLKEGQKTEARAEFGKVEALRPADLDHLKEWFAEQVR
jgi:hypothetical protein